MWNQCCFNSSYVQQVCTELQPPLRRCFSPPKERVHQPSTFNAAMPSSFIKDANPPPIRYRTPSPPIHAFERLSPALYEKTPAEALGFGLWWAHNNETSNGRKRHHISEGKDGNDALGDYRPSCGTMDALASIALATKPNGLYMSRTSIDGLRNNGSHNGEPPAKRARSEKLPSSDWQRKSMVSDIRPATSYEQLPESRRLEAELLVNFAQEAAKLTTPSPILSKAIPNHLRRPSELPMLPPPAPTIAHTSDGRPDDIEDLRPRDVEDVQGPPFSPLSNPGMDDEPTASEGGSGHDGDAVRSDTPNNLLKPQVDTETHLHVMPNAEPLDSSELSDQQPGVRTAEPELDVNHEYGSVPEKTDDQKPEEVVLFNTKVEAEDHQTLEKRTLAENETRVEADAVPPLDDTAQTREENALRVMENNALEMMEDALQPQTVGQVMDDHVLVDEGLEGQPPDDVKENESRVMHGPMGSNVKAVTESSTLRSIGADELAPDLDTIGIDNSDTQTADAQPSSAMATAVCAACNFARNSVAIEKDDNSTSWISCDACKDWFHFACAGFKNEREVRSVDKFRCRKCKPIHGATTYVRKSSRAHIPIDYAGLHQGVIKTSDESPEHHYIKPIKDGTITFLPENFARMRPELVTAEFFEKGIGMKEPVVIPACFNPQPSNYDSLNGEDTHIGNETRPNPLDDSKIAEEWFLRHEQSDMIQDQGQDALDMVIPQGLTVRKVCDLYGPEEKVEVIDVKSQNGENRKWNMRRWADYYENSNNKVVRNVISLEVSQSKLGRLIRRPKIVRDLDLQDSVWPQDLLAKGEYPRVQFYCLMSVADCFTDFHIDFGGSSVFYHILKGKKTFLFIPPKEKHLKKYEEWCMSPAQNWTFLGDQTKECYRVDLSEGDTMLIPAGWIHAVWTPEDSLVIGGNFLTRMNFAMQLRVAEVEKATGVARKFRYPSFQKLQWYTALRYLEDDALPNHVRDLLHSGGTFHRERSTYLDFDAWGENSRPGSENYHAKYYSQSELEGLPNLVRYLLRTALIDIGSITDGISTDTRNAVKKAIPRAHGHGEPLEIVKAFAAWVAWKRGDEPIPHWAYPDAIPETLAPDKLSAAATKKLDREAALSAPRRQSARMQSQQQASEKRVASQEVGSVPKPAASSTELSTPTGAKRPFPDFSVHGEIDLMLSDTSKRPRIAETSSSHRKTACESCRKRRRACKHKDQVAANVPEPAADVASSNTTPAMRSSNMAIPETPSRSRTLDNELIHSPEDFAARLKTLPQDVLAGFPKPEQRATVNAFTKLGPPIVIPPGRPRTKACNECRKSKVRDIPETDLKAH